MCFCSRGQEGETMLPGQSHQIPSMGMPPGYAPMMQWEDPGGMPQQVIMMTAPTGQQIALTSVYPMPQVRIWLFSQF